MAGAAVVGSQCTGWSGQCRLPDTQIIVGMWAPCSSSVWRKGREMSCDVASIHCVSAWGWWSVPGWSMMAALCGCLAAEAAEGWRCSWPCPHTGAHGMDVRRQAVDVFQAVG